jgi:hypothetical protein
MAADPDGISNGSSNARTLVSLADTAFTPLVPGNFVTLIIGVGENISTLSAGGTGATEGAEPISVTVGGTPYFTVLQNGTTYYTYLDLAKVSAFSASQPLQLVIRTTLPSATFTCSGHAVPFNTAEYTNDTNGAGLMGPYIPLVDYPLVSSLPTTANTSSSNLPSESYCGNIPGRPTVNGTSNTINYPTGVVQWPTYWQSTVYPPPLSLNCATQSASSPTFSFVSTQWPYSAMASAPSLNCTGTFSNCTNIASQTIPAAEQVEGQPPLPITIVGQGFGYLPEFQNPDSSWELGLPFVPPVGYASSKFLEISNKRANSTIWDTATNPACQVLISNWTATSISLTAAVPVSAYTGYLPGPSNPPVSPLNDLSPLSFFYENGTNTISSNTMDCSIQAGDLLTFIITNPQSGVSSSTSPIQVQ